MIVHDADREIRFPITSDVMRGQGIKSYYVFPLTPAGRRLGVMGFGCKDAFGCSDEGLEFMRQVVKQVAVAVGNALNFESAEAARRELAAERDRLRLLLEVNNAVVTNLDLHDLFAAVSAALRAVLHHEFVSLSLYDPAGEELRVHVLDFAGGKGLVREGISVRVEDAPSGLALRARRPVPLTIREIERRFDSDYARGLMNEGIKSGCGFPLVAHGRPLGTLVVASLTEETFPQSDIEMLSPIADQIAIAVENALQFGELSELKNKLAAEKLYLEEEIRTERNFAEIIGRSPALRHVLKEVELTAHTWAGNIRELENFVERAVILTRGTELQAPFAELRPGAVPTYAATPAGEAGLLSLEENERRHVEAVLRHTKGVVGGKGGAAEILGLPVSTLRSRMKRLGLK